MMKTLTRSQASAMVIIRGKIACFFLWSDADSVVGITFHAGTHRVGRLISSTIR